MISLYKTMSLMKGNFFLNAASSNDCLTFFFFVCLPQTAGAVWNVIWTRTPTLIYAMKNAASRKFSSIKLQVKDFLFELIVFRGPFHPRTCFRLFVYLLFIYYSKYGLNILLISSLTKRSFFSFLIMVFRLYLNCNQDFGF